MSILKNKSCREARLQTAARGIRHLDPPLFGRKQQPLSKIKRMKTNPIFDEALKPKSEPTIDKQIINIVWSTFTKKAHNLVFPFSPSGQPSKQVFEWLVKPAKNFIFGGAKTFTPSYSCWSR
jgi:hypothetical protein